MSCHPPMATFWLHFIAGNAVYIAASIGKHPIP
jgi:hypothetical protein